MAEYLRCRSAIRLALSSSPMIPVMPTCCLAIGVWGCRGVHIHSAVSDEMAGWVERAFGFGYRDCFDANNSVSFCYGVFETSACPQSRDLAEPLQPRDAQRIFAMQACP